MNQPARPTSSTGASQAGPVPLLDLSRENGPLREEILAALESVFDSGRYVLGPQVTEFEQAVAEYCRVEHAVGCASGSDAVLLALMALDIKPGDEVIVPSFTFFATASAVWRLGATPVFADIDPGTFNLDPQCVAEAVTPATKAIIPVHLFGQCADMTRLCEIARRHNLSLIEDAAQAIGAEYEGRPAGGWGDIACFSFYPTKNLGGLGDAGMLTTRDAQLADRLRLLAAHGMRPRYHHSHVGVNSRLDSLQAAALHVKLRHLPGWTEQRRENAADYQQRFTESGLDKAVTLPKEAAGCRHVWNQFTVRIDDGRRDEVRRLLAERGVGSEIYYPVPLHLQECFRPLGYEAGSLPATEAAAVEVLSLPIFPGLTSDERRTVATQLASCLQFVADRQFRAA
ncbi:MAG: DegT/DnrJ/EryC1/StrS family aminotransferase [Pirellulaceae bacterium]